ncbi:hypothetical protein SKAU_G00256880 [Synaphobranchus kaupii]|uniref:Uncharacterized protein n=1 Tax=Synaphobranchus kaupii TaxID=118154 RepID=A0A9Q1IS59_SYNKA|nr:hypothetical protein SKAU_G00256880 [Synaphobranchus kaupii]
MRKQTPVQERGRGSEAPEASLLTGKVTPETAARPLGQRQDIFLERLWLQSTKAAESLFQMQVGKPAGGALRDLNRSGRRAAPCVADASAVGGQILDLRGPQEKV